MMELYCVSIPKKEYRNIKNHPFGITKNLFSAYSTVLWSFYHPHNVLLFELLFLCFVYKYFYTKEDKQIDLLIIVYVSMCLYAEFFMPEMYLLSTRYIMYIMPLIAVVTIWYLVFVLKSFKIKDKHIKSVLYLIVFINALFVDLSTRSPYAFNAKPYQKNDITGNVIFLTDQHTFLFENIAILLDAQRVYPVSLKIPEEEILKETDKADYLIMSNIRTTKDILLKPKDRAQISPVIKNKLDFIKTIKLGEGFYDIYRIKHKKNNTKRR